MNSRSMLPYKLLQVILLTVLSSATKAAEDATITYIDLSGSGGTTFDMCWTGTSSDFTYAELTIIQQGVTEKPISGAANPATKCATLENDIAITIAKDDTVAFILRLFVSQPLPGSNALEERAEPDGQGTARVDLWPDVATIVECDSAYKVAGGVGTMKTLRLHYTAPITSGDKVITDNGNELSIVGNSDIAADTVYYLLDATSIAPGSLKICRSVAATINDEDSKTMDICKSSIDVLVATEHAPTVTDAELNYNSKETTVTATTALDSDVFETIHYWETGTTGIYELSAVCTPDPTCSVGSYVTGLKTLNIILVGYKSTATTAMLEAFRHPFQDYNLQVSLLFTSTLELRWDPSNAGQSIFTITIDCDEEFEADSFTSAQVTCSDEDSGCYGYFLGIPDAATTCTPTLQPDNGGPDPMNKILTSVLRTQRTENDLTIHHTQVYRYQYDSKASVLVCFNHTSYNEETLFSHYEFVIVNQKGQWLKHKLLSQDTEGDICFSPFTFSTEAFNVTGRVTLIVTQRAEDRFTVLASGEARILFNRTSYSSYQSITA